MADQMLVDLILHGSEERNIEYKGSMNWNDINTKIKVVKTAMSMANLKDGGFMIFGVEEDDTGICRATGMDLEDADSFNQDDVMDYVNKYADPYVELKVERVELNENVFIVIQISEFEELPVICKKNGEKLYRGSIYTRPRRKNESVPISSQTEMRELIERAVDKRMRKYREKIFKWGLIKGNGLQENDFSKFDSQLEKWEHNERINKIKERGYWFVNIRPRKYEEKAFDNLTSIHELVENSHVILRGWDYPHIDREGIKNGQDWIQSGCDWRGYIESWRYYQSGQFAHYFSLREDYILNKDKVYTEDTSTTGYISIFSILFKLTEIFEFTMRLAEKNAFNNQVQIHISLNNIKGYKLFYWERGRHLHREYVSEIPSIKAETILDVDELIARGHEEAVSLTSNIFERFNWNNPPKKLFIEEQKKLLERRL